MLFFLIQKTCQRMAQRKQQPKFERNPRVMFRDNCDTDERTTDEFRFHELCWHSQAEPKMWQKNQNFTILSTSLVATLGRRMRGKEIALAVWNELANLFWNFHSGKTADYSVGSDMEYPPRNPRRDNNVTKKKKKKKKTVRQRKNPPANKLPIKYHWQNICITYRCPTTRNMSTVSLASDLSRSIKDSRVWFLLKFNRNICPNWVRIYNI